MADKETGKQRAARIPLDYFKRETPLEFWKATLGLLALGISLVWGASGFWRTRGDLRYSRGDVAHVHQTWNNDCAACHESFKTIQGPDHWAAQLFPAWFKSTRKKEEHLCKTCHDGPAHSQHEKAPPDCAQCHREHGGADASLIRMDDRDCTQCHANLTASVKSGAKTETPATMHNIKTFSKSGGHGDFSRLTNVASAQKLKFNHKLHMAAGLATPETGDPKFTPDRLSPADQQRYVKNGRVQLECASCHQLDAGNRAAGDYMLPIRYEAHCQACHPLTFERTVADDPKSGTMAVPHGLQPREIRQILQGVYTAKALKEEWKVFDRLVPARPLPGKSLGEDAVKVGKLLQDKIVAAEKQLYFGKKACGECHENVPAVDFTKTKPPVPIQQELDVIAPTNIPQVWFHHARFDHVAHRGVSCQACHEQGTKADGQTKTTMSESLKADDIFIPGMDVCVKCHAPKTSAGGGARFDCTECHRYHNGGEHALQGLGAAARDPQPPNRRRALDDFILNKKN